MERAPAVPDSRRFASAGAALEPRLGFSFVTVRATPVSSPAWRSSRHFGARSARRSPPTRSSSLKSCTYECDALTGHRAMPSSSSCPARWTRCRRWCGCVPSTACRSSRAAPGPGGLGRRTARRPRRRDLARAARPRARCLPPAAAASVAARYVFAPWGTALESHMATSRPARGGRRQPLPQRGEGPGRREQRQERREVRLASAGTDSRPRRRALHRHAVPGPASAEHRRARGHASSPRRRTFRQPVRVRRTPASSGGPSTSPGGATRVSSAGRSSNMLNRFAAFDVPWRAHSSTASAAASRSPSRRSRSSGWNGAGRGRRRSGPARRSRPGAG